MFPCRRHCEETHSWIKFINPSCLSWCSVCVTSGHVEHRGKQPTLIKGTTRKKKGIGSWIARLITYPMLKHQRKLLRSPLKEDKIIDSLLRSMITIHLHHGHRSSPGNQSLGSWSLFPSPYEVVMEMEMRQRWWSLGFCTGAGGERGILCMFNSANFTRDDAGLLSWYNMFLYFYEWAIYAASMEDPHLVENNGKWWGSASQGYRSDIWGPQWAHGR